MMRGSRRCLYILLFAVIALLSHGVVAQELPHTHLKPTTAHFLKHIPEPSDIIYDAPTNHLFIVSDHGLLFECDTTGKVLREAAEKGLDFEGIEIRDSIIYVADETPRKVYQYRKSDLSLIRVVNLNWGGAMNKAYESLAWNEARKCYIMVAEQPAVIVEYSEAFQELNRHHFTLTRDISSARWYNGYMYLLSDLNHEVIKVDPNTYQPLAYYTINVLNPEGLAFFPDGRLIITSDNEQRIYLYNQLPITNIK
ncbi:MAG: hypothetical protein EBZ77_01750 [Chitinophagia bacterium]|nr:hypothetical protein [Chitinophagia bacterium]